MYTRIHPREILDHCGVSLSEQHTAGIIMIALATGFVSYSGLAWAKLHVQILSRISALYEQG